MSGKQREGLEEEGREGDGKGGGKGKEKRKGGTEVGGRVGKVW